MFFASNCLIQAIASYVKNMLFKLYKIASRAAVICKFENLDILSSRTLSNFDSAIEGFIAQLSED